MCLTWKCGIQPDWEWSVQTGTSPPSADVQVVRIPAEVLRRRLRRSSIVVRPSVPKKLRFRTMDAVTGRAPSPPGSMAGGFRQADGAGFPEYSEDRIWCRLPWSCSDASGIRRSSMPDFFRRTTHGSSGESSTALTSRSAVMRGSGDAPLPDWLEAAGGLTSGSLTRGSSDSLLMLPTGQRNPARLNDRIRNEQETKAVSCPSSTTTVFDRLCDQHGGAIRQAGMGLCDDTRPVLDQSSGIAGSSAAGSPSRRRLPGCRIRFQTTPDSLCDDTGFPSPAGRYFLYTCTRNTARLESTAI